MARVNNLFYSELAGMTAGEVFYNVRGLDKTKTSFDDRLEVVDKFLEDTPFFEEYFDSQFNCHLNAGSELSSKNNVCNMIEIMADYLLMSDESKELSKQEETAYVFTDEYLEKKIKREMFDVPSEKGMVNIVDNSNIQIVKRPNKRNHIINQGIQITKKDLSEDSFLGQVLRDYNSLLETIKYNTEHKIGNKRKLSYHQHAVSGDMIEAKASLKGIWGGSMGAPSANFQKPFDYFDFEDADTLKSLLQVKGDFFESYSLWLTCMELQMVLDKIELTSDEQVVRTLLYGGYNIIDIQDTTGINAYRIRRTIIPNIIKKIQKQHIKYDAEDKKLNERINELKMMRSSLVTV